MGVVAVADATDGNVGWFVVVVVCYVRQAVEGQVRSFLLRGY